MWCKICVCAHVFADAHTLCICIQRPEEHIKYPPIKHLTYFYETGYLPEPGPHCFSPRLGVQVSVSSCLLPNHHWGYRHAFPCLTF